MLADDIQRLAPDFRAEAHSLMIDRVAISRPGGEPTFDTGTGLLTPAAPTTIYSDLPCRLRQPTVSESEVLFGDETLTRTRFIACVPHDTVGVLVGDVLTFTDSNSGNEDLTARTFRITGVPLGTFEMYRGFPVELVE